MTSAINPFHRSFSASDAALLFSPATGSSATTSSRAPLISGGTLESGFQNDARNSGQRALARIVEILELSGAAEDAGGTSVSETMGYVTQARGTDGDDKLTIDARAAYGIESGAGNDTLTIRAGGLSGLSAGDGNDSVKAVAAFLGGIDGGEGNDEIALSGKLAMDIYGGAGDDTIRIAADTIIGADGGDGDDVLQLEGNRIFAYGGAGNDTVSFTRTGKAEDSVFEYGFGRGDGQDTVTSNAPIALRLTGYSKDDLEISITGNALTARFKGSDDRITVTLDSTRTDSAAATFGFAFDQGDLMLKVG